MHLKVNSPMVMVHEDLWQVGRHGTRKAESQHKKQHVGSRSVDTVISQTFPSPKSAFIHPDLDQGRPGVSSISATPLSSSYS